MTRGRCNRDAFGVCRLHRDWSPLVRSHIIPEILYKPSYDHRHKAVQLSGTPLSEGWLQKGYRERLLCPCCERYVNETFEKPFQREWIDSGVVPDQINDVEVVRRVNIDYTTVKLFHLSVLWRASVARIPPFSDVALGPHEDRIRQMLVGVDPGSWRDYPTVGVLLHLDRTVAKASLFVHTRSRMDGATYYTSIYGGCMWLQFTSPNPPIELYPLLLRENGALTLVTMSLTDLGFVQKAVQEVRTRGSRLREP